jgi:ribonuclease HII
LQATFLAMRRAVEQLSVQPEFALVDGNRDPGLTIPTETIVGGDGKSANIAAASILAKVTRDRYMEQMAEQYPQYGFEIHKGYGTKRHYAAIEEFGASPIHRKTFLKKFYEKK